MYIFVHICTYIYVLQPLKPNQCPFITYINHLHPHHLCEKCPQTHSNVCRQLILGHLGFDLLRRNKLAQHSGSFMLISWTLDNCHRYPVPGQEDICANLSHGVVSQFTGCHPLPAPRHRGEWRAERPCTAIKLHEQTSSCLSVLQCCVFYTHRIMRKSKCTFFKMRVINWNKGE